MKLAGAMWEHRAARCVGRSGDGVAELLEAQGIGAMREEQKLCALELAMTGARASGVEALLRRLTD